MDQTAFLEDLDQRQNAVLDQLAELNARVEALLQECLQGREAENTVESPPKTVSSQEADAVNPSDRGAPTSRSRAAGGGRRARS